MSNLEIRHLDDGQLLRYLDGELSRGKARQVRRHLEACWQCRAELEGLEAAVADSVKYRKNVLGACLPAPPQAWKDLSGEFDRIDASIAVQSLAARLVRALTPRRPSLRWAAAALVGVIAITFYQLRETPSVQAAALLKRAVLVSESRSHAVRRVRISTRTRQITKVIGGSALETGASIRPAVAGEAELAEMFREAKYDFGDPLSAKSYANWHDRLSAKQDSVNTIPDRQSPDRGTWEIKTTTDEGSLVEATLKLRMTDYEPLAGRFEFRNREWVEMTELVDQQTPPASAVAGTTGGMPRQPGVPPAFITDPVETKRLGRNEELQVVEALHEVGADLGEPVEISREGRQVMVSGTGIPPRRQAQLHAVLDPLPNVVVRFADPALPASNQPVQTEPATPRDAAGPESKQLEARIEERLGGRPQFERFSGQLLDWTDSAMARAYALRRLAQEFPAEAERQMSPADRRALRNLGREHLAAFADETAKVKTTLTPILAALGAPPVEAPAADRAPDAGWQPAAEELLSAARQVESLLAVVLGAAPAERPVDNTPAQLMSALAQLTARIEQCQRHLPYDDIR